MPFSEIGKVLINIGVIVVVIGIVLKLIGKFGIQKLPGDIFIKGENFSFYFPIVTCIVISIVLSLIFSFIRRL